VNESKSLSTTFNIQSIIQETKPSGNIFGRDKRERALKREGMNVFHCLNIDSSKQSHHKSSIFEREKRETERDKKREREKENARTLSLSCFCLLAFQRCIYTNTTSINPNNPTFSREREKRETERDKERKRMRECSHCLVSVC